MKKVFKGLSVLLASTALCAGIATATACSGGYNGTYTGEYKYSSYGHDYGMKVRVTVENNIITKVEDITKGAYVVVSDGWSDYFKSNPTKWLLTTESKNDDGSLTLSGVKDTAGADPVAGAYYYWSKDKDGKVDKTKVVKWDENAEKVVVPDVACTTASYGWSDEAKKNWTSKEALLLQKFEGWSVADVLAVKVYIDDSGVPYGKEDNAAFLSSDLLIVNATQGSGRLMLAVQDALGQKTEIGRIEK